MKHVMVDIETLATTQRARVLSIGYQEFRLDGVISGTGANGIIHLEDQPNRETNSRTVSWWEKQSDSARAAAFGRPEQCVPVPDGLERFAAVVSNAYVWASPVAFDLGILGDLYDQTGMPRPWHYRHERDVRTLTALAANRLGVPEIPRHRPLNAHDPRSDCIAQIRDVDLALRILNNR